MLTGLIRRTLPTAPLHVFTAPEAGSGKGLLCNVVSIIVTGNRSAAVTFGHNDDEFKKLLFSALLQNVQVIVIDNIDRPFTGTSLNSALTELELEDRILGVSRTARVPTNALFMANGNNIQVVGDTHRRVIACRIDAGENPEQRRFRQPNLLGYVEQHRPELVAAGLTILRAYECAGRPYPKDLPEFGSYEDWSHRVRGALVWLGQSDPCMSRDQVRAADQEKLGLGLLLHVVHRLDLGWFTARASYRPRNLDDRMEHVGSDGRGEKPPATQGYGYRMRLMMRCPRSPVAFSAITSAGIRIAWSTGCGWKRGAILTGS